MEREEKLYIATHPIRLKILKILEKEEPLYVNQIVERLRNEGVDVDRKLVSYHLSRLLQYGLVEGEFRLLNPHPLNDYAVRSYNIAVKYFRLTDEARKILLQISKSL